MGKFLIFFFFFGFVSKLISEWVHIIQNRLSFEAAYHSKLAYRLKAKKLREQTQKTKPLIIQSSLIVRKNKKGLVGSQNTRMDANAENNENSGKFAKYDKRS